MNAAEIKTSARGASARRLGVLHLVDSLAVGGAERVAVHCVNLLPRQHYRVGLGTTRRDGPLLELVAHDVAKLGLQRRYRLSPGPILALRRWLRAQRIDLIHAHGTALFVAIAATTGSKRVRVIWHDHGPFAYAPRRSRAAFRLAATQLTSVVVVDRALGQWTRQQLGVKKDRIHFLPNFVDDTQRDRPTPTELASSTTLELPGEPGARIVCVAGLRPPKDHLTLLRAMQQLARDHDQAHLLLVGGAPDAEYEAELRAQTVALGIDDRVSFLGQRHDVEAILDRSAVGVLSSSGEGLPLALLEYGRHALPSVATDVGECAEVLDGGKCGWVAPSQSPEALALALLAALSDPGAAERGRRFQERVRTLYTRDGFLERLQQIYAHSLEVPS